ncbi:IclR family transcriptional regulator [Haloglomus litoreum]|uniref:IclR family transcriptional regulator n=1 Tax=Haloglomus litoreum TaxID=3034026 RepID=UPI0023E78E36|nr:IclR family transcriptional regulator [Haloglomus sp. DT116]
MTDDTTNSRGIKTAERVFDIIELIRDLDGATTSEVASGVDIAKSTAHEYLQTLESREYLVREGDTFYLSLRFLDHGMHATNRFPSERVVRPVIDRVADETEELVWFTVEEHGRVIDLYRSAGQRALTVGAWVGKRSHMHHLAAGKAILAHLPESRVREILETHGLPRMTEHTVTDPEALLAELETIRERGVAFNDEETTLGMRSVAVPVLQEEAPVGSIIVTGPAKRMKGDRFRTELPDLLLAASNELELKLLAEST